MFPALLFPPLIDIRTHFVGIKGVYEGIERGDREVGYGREEVGNSIRVQQKEEPCIKWEISYPYFMPSLVTHETSVAKGPLVNLDEVVTCPCNTTQHYAKFTRFLSSSFTIFAIFRNLRFSKKAETENCAWAVNKALMHE